MAEERVLPTKRLRRLQEMARVGARSGLALLGGGDGAKAAQHAADLLGNLRGLAAKVGQMASYVDGLIPDGQSAAYARFLSSLQASAPSSPFAEVRNLLEHELAASVEERFAAFEEAPFASASIGQVHRARMHDRREVAVKIQHPGIADALEADLSSAGVVASLVSALTPKGVQADAIYQEIAARFREELDYELEARRQSEFRELFAGDPRIHVPRIFATHSSRRVLTSELVRGLDFNAAIGTDLLVRRAYAQVLWRFVFTSILAHGQFNADPHPGNYLFHSDGRVTFLDFGCIQKLPAAYVEAMRGMHKAALNCDEAAFHEAARAGLNTVAGAYEEALLAYLWRCYEPLRRSPYRIERKYVAEVVRGIQGVKQHMMKKSSNPTPTPPGVMLLNRLQFGFYSVLARLQVDVDYAKVDREILSGLGSTETRAASTDTVPALGE